MRGRLSRSAWYWRRLRAMSAGEALWRAERVLRGGWSRAVWRDRPQRPAVWTAAAGRAGASASVRAAARVLVPDAPGTRARFRERFPDGVETARIAAEALLRHRVDLFARRAVDLGERIDWHRDCATGRAWPQVHAGRIRLRDGETIGEVRTVWELARHHHLVTLAKAAFLTGDMRFAREVADQWRGWIEQNPPGRGVHWTSPLEMAIRIQNWSWALAFLSGTPALDDASLDLILGAYQDQADAIASNMSRFSSANNHRIGEAAGLAVAGSLFPGLRGAARWRRRGFRILEEEALRQIHPDGVGKEQSPHYLAFVIDFYALAAAAAARSGEAFPSRPVAERIGLAAEFLACLGDERGETPQIGDSDEGRAVGLFAFGDGPFVAAIREGAHLSGRAAACAGLPPSEQAFWIFGEEIAATSPALAATGLRVFGDGGYAVFRSPRKDDGGAVVAVLDAGDLGYLSLAAHGHADALSIWLSVSGRWVLADAGTYSYQAEWPWRRYFKGTSAHNTLVVDGTDASEIAGPFLWGRRAAARLVRWDEQDGCWSAIGEHDGYRSLRDPARHRRQVVFLPPGFLVVVDRLDGRGAHAVSAHFHAPPEIEVTLDGMEAAFAHDGETLLRIHAAAAPGSRSLSARVARGEKTPPLGWFSPRFGVKMPSPTLVYSTPVTAPCTLAWLLACGPDASARAEVRVASDGAVSARLGAGSAARVLTISPDGSVAAGGRGEGV